MIDSEPCLLPYRPCPLPDEALPSYLFRLAEGNGYAPHAILMSWLRRLGSLSAHESFRHMVPHRLLPILHQVTDQPVDKLYATMYHRFAPILELPDKEIAYGQMNKDAQFAYFADTKAWSLFVRSSQNACICPLCLREASYLRLPWMLKMLVVCPQHQCYLITSCPCCQETLTFRSVMGGHCVICGFSLGDSEVLHLSRDDLVWQAQECITGWLYGQSAPAQLKFPHASERVLFRILYGLRTIANAVGPQWSGAYKPQRMMLLPAYADVVQQGCSWASALQGLMNWPDGFFAFLDHYRFRPQAAQPHLLKSLHVLYSVWIHRHWQRFDFLQAAFNQYLVQYLPPTRGLKHSTRLDRYPELKDQLTFIDFQNAAHILHVTPPVVKGMVEDGLLDIYPNSDVSGIFLYRSQVEAVARQQHTGCSKRGVAEKLGVSIEVVDKLLNAGLLQQTGISPYPRQRICFFHDDDITTFQARLAQLVHIDPQAMYRRISLRQAAEWTGKVGLGISGILQRVLNGKLIAYHSHAQPLTLRDLYFDPSDVDGLVEQVKHENRWLGFLEVVAILGITQWALHDWMAHEVLLPVASFAKAQYFSSPEVMGWKQRLMTSDDVAHYLCTYRANICRWAQTEQLHTVRHVGRYLFDRVHVEQWHQRYITIGELKKLLQVNTAQVSQWRHSGTLLPANEAYPQPWFYFRADVIQLQKQLMMAQKL